MLVMENKSIETISECDLDDESKNNKVDLDEALSIAGMGKYNIKFTLNLAMFLISVIIEPLGYSFILPAAKCDLDMSDTQRGIIASIPYVGIVIGSFPWGYLVDTRGRKKMIIKSSLAAGIFSALSAFMPNAVTFGLLKFFSSLCLACPGSVPYSFIGEILPPKYRDIMLSVTNALQISGSVLVPVIASGIIPLDFSFNFGLYYFRSWRLLTIIYACFFILSATLLSFGPESPKYLISQGRHDESLETLKKIYAGNTGKSPDEYPVKSLKLLNDVKKEHTSFFQSLRQQSVPLLKPPYLKWIILNSTLFFGIYATLNGLTTWIPDVLNRVISGNNKDFNACQIVKEKLNETITSTVCDDTIDNMIYVINSLGNFSCAMIALFLSSTVKFIGKKTLLIFVLVTIGIFIMIVNFVTHKVLFVIFFSSVPVLGLTFGPINAYAVETFPTYLRGMAISLTIMIGRSGAIVGTNAVGILLNTACEITFYAFGGTMLMCALLSFLLPQAKAKASI